jgi:hypothetical protein
MFGHESLEEFVRRESEATREFIHEEVRSLREHLRAEREEMRDLNREILLRNEKVHTGVLAELEEGRKQIEEGRKQIAADTRAVLSVLDRFEGGAGA